jgi:hypothetical protein
MKAYFIIYGRRELCLILARHAFGTFDVQRADGKCFRVSGLGANDASA